MARRAMCTGVDTDKETLSGEEMLACFALTFGFPRGMGFAGIQHGLLLLDLSDGEA